MPHVNVATMLKELNIVILREVMMNGLMCSLKY